MNGLKYIRIRCNLSSTELASILGVTRQALSAWENGKKEIPEHRVAELSEYFGIDGKYFDELSDADVDCILTKAMFRYELNGKETYKFKPELQEYTDMMWFPEHREMSLDEELSLAKKKKQEMLDKIDRIIGNTDSPYMVDRINRIHRDCAIYEMVNDLMVHLNGTDYLLKVPFADEMRSVYKAMLVAYGLRDKAKLEYRDIKNNRYEDGEWIIKLAEIFEEHWCDEKSRVENTHKGIKE